MIEVLNILGLLSLLFLSLFFVVLFHEMGHALAMMVLAKGDIKIYIGSYGESNNSIKIKTGRLLTQIKYNPFKWIRGLCIPPATYFSTNHQIFFTAAGPAMSIGSGFIALFIFWHVNPGVVRFELFLFSIVSLSVGITNLFPRILSKRTSAGQVLATDGYRLPELFRDKFLTQEYATARELFTKGLYLESSMVLQNLIEAGNKNKFVLRLAIISNLHAKV